MKHPVAPYVSYKQGPSFSVGANQLVFDQETSLPAISAYGTGTVPDRNLQLFTPVNLRYVPTFQPSGIGGTPAGGFYFQPLTDPLQDTMS